MNWNLPRLRNWTKIEATNAYRASTVVFPPCLRSLEQAEMGLVSSHVEIHTSRSYCGACRSPASDCTSDKRFLLQRAAQRSQINPASCQQPSPQATGEQDIKEVKDQRSSENNRIITPGILRCHPNSRDCDGPRQHPEQIRS